MARLNVSQAAKAAGISRSSIYAHIKKGRLTAHRGDDGRQYIDTSELARVYGKLRADGVSTGVELDTIQGVHEVSTPSAVEVEALQAENRLLRDQLRKAEEREEEARHQVKDLLDVIKSQARLLEAPGGQEAPGRRRRRWWQFRR